MDKATENEIWSRLGLSPEAFPAFDAASPKFFEDNGGDANAVAGATVQVGYSLDNFPRMLLGMRIENIWQLPEEPEPEEVALAEYVSRVVDHQQTVEINLTQNNITLRNSVPQSSIQGKGGYVWHGFPVAYPGAGGNDVNIYVRRQTAYPIMRGVRINPKVHITLVSIILRGDRPTMAIQRRDA